jgi:uncharacterized CHY-type Zn-finger protein
MFLILIFITYIIKSTQLSNNFCKSCFKCKNGFTGVGIIPYKQLENEKKFIIQIDNKNELSDFSYKIFNSNAKLCQIVHNGLLSESYNFNISISEIASSDYIDIPNKDHKYRCYFVNIIENMKTDKNNLISLNESILKDDIFIKSIPYMYSNRLEKILLKYFL